MANSKKIMIVDDDTDHLLSLTLILRNKGYQVLSLLGCESLEMLDAEVSGFHPDLIFMDHEMPVVCGSDAVKMLKAHPIHRGIPIIYFSGHERIESLARAAGADHWLRKPYVLQHLIEVTEQCLS
jgi:CheY-like chemotaxis protein